MILTPKQSTWYIIYTINGEDIDKTELKDFSNGFRLRYENFKELLQELNCNPMFAKWGKGTTDCNYHLHCHSYYLELCGIWEEGYL